jgi:hypothetical protein
MKRFTCTKCGAVELKTGGTCGFVCASCRIDAGQKVGRTNQEEAHHQVARAIRLGHMKPAREFGCTDCPAPAIEYDHRDYSKPLTVDPVCRRCNLKRGPALNHV